jgi:hypothetical protein
MAHICHTSTRGITSCRQVVYRYGMLKLKSLALQERRITQSIHIQFTLSHSPNLRGFQIAQTSEASSVQDIDITFTFQHLFCFSGSLSGCTVYDHWCMLVGNQAFRRHIEERAFRQCALRVNPLTVRLEKTTFQNFIDASYIQDSCLGVGECSPDNFMRGKHKKGRGREKCATGRLGRRRPRRRGAKNGGGCWCERRKGGYLILWEGFRRRRNDE